MTDTRLCLFDSMQRPVQCPDDEMSNHEMSDDHDGNIDEDDADDGGGDDGDDGDDGYDGGGPWWTCR